MDLQLDLGAISDGALKRVGAACHEGSIPWAVDALVVGDSIVGVAADAGTLVVGMKLLESHEGEIVGSEIQVWLYRLYSFFLEEKELT